MRLLACALLLISRPAWALSLVSLFPIFPSTQVELSDLFTHRIEDPSGLPGLFTGFGDSLVVSDRGIFVSAPLDDGGKIYFFSQAPFSGASPFSLVDTVEADVSVAKLGKEMTFIEPYLFVAADQVEAEGSCSARLFVFELEELLLCTASDEIICTFEGSLVERAQGACGEGTGEFGITVAVDGSNEPDSYRVYVGDPGDCQGEVVCSGAFYEYLFEPGNELIRFLGKRKSDFLARKSKGSGTPARFGEKIVNRGDKVVVSAPGSPIQDAIEGAIDIFRMVGGNLEGFDTRSGDEPGDGYGDSVDLEGDILVVGAPGANGGQGEVDVIELGDNAIEIAVDVALDPSVGLSGLGAGVEVDAGETAVVAADSNNPYANGAATQNAVIPLNVREIIDRAREGKGQGAAVVLGVSDISFSLVGSTDSGFGSSISLGSSMLAVGSLLSLSVGFVEVTVPAAPIFRAGFEPETFILLP